MSHKNRYPCSISETNIVVVGRYLAHRFLECIFLCVQGDEPAWLDPVPCGRHNLPRPQSRVIIMTVRDSVYPFYLSVAVVAVGWSHRTWSTLRDTTSLECSAGVTDVWWDVTLLLFFRLKYIFIDWDARSVCQDHTPPAVDQRQHQGENMSSLVFVMYHVNNMISMDKW